MDLHQGRQSGTLIKRYKRFLADIRLPDGSTLTAHCPNSGSMLGCSTPGSPVILTHSDNPRRKYAWTLEMVQENGVWIGVNTSRTNHLVEEALEQGKIKELTPFDTLTREIRTSVGTRLDFLLEHKGKKTYLEVKNCSLAEGGMALFPDAVTQRGTKHLLELAQLRRQGHGAALLFCIQRTDVTCFKPAEHIDPHYATTLAEVLKQGVQVLAYVATVTPEAITVNHHIPVWRETTP
jgi:sugar fermentation stimulation protein A